MHSELLAVSSLWGGGAKERLTLSWIEVLPEGRAHRNAQSYKSSQVVAGLAQPKYSQ